MARESDADVAAAGCARVPWPWRSTMLWLMGVTLVCCGVAAGVCQATSSNTPVVGDLGARGAASAARRLQSWVQSAAWAQQATLSRWAARILQGSKSPVGSVGDERQEWQAPLKRGSGAPTIAFSVRPSSRIQFQERKNVDQMVIDYLDVAGGAGKGQGGPKIFCSIWTYEKNHKGLAKAVWETWAQRCDGFVAYSNVADPSIGAISITVPGQRMPSGKDNMISKSRVVWLHIYRHYLLDYDYFFQAGDDTYLIVDNLRALLREPQWAEPHAEGVPLFVGRPMTHDVGTGVMNIGGPGVVINRRALHLLGSRFDFGQCGLGLVGWYEDVVSTRCFKELGIVPQDTRDEMKRELFHPFTPATHAGMNMTHIGLTEKTSWYARGSYGLLDGFNCCSPHSVSFHYCPMEMLYSLDRGLYSTKVQSRPVIP